MDLRSLRITCQECFMTHGMQTAQGRSSIQSLHDSSHHMQGTKYLPIALHINPISWSARRFLFLFFFSVMHWTSHGSSSCCGASSSSAPMHRLSINFSRHLTLPLFLWLLLPSAEWATLPHRCHPAFFQAAQMRFKQHRAAGSRGPEPKVLHQTPALRQSPKAISVGG